MIWIVLAVWCVLSVPLGLAAAMLLPWPDREPLPSVPTW